jgi:hypothetical protein
VNTAARKPSQKVFIQFGHRATLAGIKKGCSIR